MILLLLATLPALASLPAMNCESRQNLRRAVQSCESNSAYYLAARHCLDKFEAEVAKSQAELAKTLAALGAADKQGTSLDKATASYRLTQNKLQELAALGKTLAGQVKSYDGEVALPDELGVFSVAGLSPAKFLKNSACYSATRSLLGTYSKLLGLKAHELELTNQISGRLGARALKGELKLSQKTRLPPLKGNGIGSANPGKEPPVAPTAVDSDITGTKPLANPEEPNR